MNQTTKTPCVGLAGQIFGHYYIGLMNKAQEWPEVIVQGTVRISASGDVKDWVNSKQECVAIICRRCGHHIPVHQAMTNGKERKSG